MLSQIARLSSLLLLLTVGCHVLDRPTIVGSGVQLVDVRDCAGFSRIQAGSIVHLEIVEGDAYQVEVQGDDNLVPLVRTNVIGDRLEIGLEGDYRISAQQPLVVRIVCPPLQELDLSGATQTTLTGNVTDVEVSGASSLEVSQLSVDQLSVHISGASKTTFQGVVLSTVTLDSSGASKTNLEQLEADLLTVSISGASSVGCGNGIRQIRGSASGASKVVCQKNTNVQVDTSGAASVKSRD
ncbi:MAG: DUF2807 domain-containing protein [Planctomycetales bacterium]|nr:DUF2807 domain-containing protein [Planctomycetales bacterium]